MRIKVIITILLFSFFTATFFSQVKKIARIFEKNVEIINFNHYSSKSIVRQANYKISLFCDSTYCVNYSVTRTSWGSNNISVTGKYYIVDNTVHFIKDSATNLASSDPIPGLLNVFNSHFVALELIDKKLIFTNPDGEIFEIDESTPFYKFLETKKTAKVRKSPLLSGDYSFSPQLSNKRNSF